MGANSLVRAPIGVHGWHFSMPASRSSPTSRAAAWPRPEVVPTCNECESFRSAAAKPN